MEGELWKHLLMMVAEVGQTVHSKRVHHSDACVVRVFLWAVLHDRPVRWACRAANWHPGQRRWARSSESTMSRRLRSDGVQAFLHVLYRRVQATWPPSWCKWIDALPLPVGGATRDPDARYGRAANTMAKGYKLYAICDARAGIEAWRVYAMNRNEKRVARELVPHRRSEGYLIGDGQYHASPLFEAAAAAGLQLISPKPRGKGLGHRRQSPERLAGLARLERPFGQALLQTRDGIERYFGQWGNFGAGLKPLPHWVRRLSRVRLWIHGKLIINVIRLWAKQRAGS
jgi:hypothetical protein